MSDTNMIDTIIGDSGQKWQTIIALLASSVGFIVAIVNSIAAYFRDKKQMEELAAQERRFEAFKKDLEDKQRRLVRFENVQELMKQYKKPLLQSAFDLQSRLANQVKSNFVYSFAQKGNERDRQYGRLNMAYVVSEFLGWLEVIRQEIVFITGSGDTTSNINLIIDGIKFQFTGDTSTQGGPPGKDEPALEENWQVMQLYAGELRAIGEVMIVERVSDADGMQGNNLSVIGYAEFVRRANAKPPGSGEDEGPVSAEEAAAWKTSKERLQQATLKPLMDHVDRLMELRKGEAPKMRLALLQVLLCKLIDVLDGAVPYDLGPEYDLELNEEPRYISRDFRLTPLVAQLHAKQRKWLAGQRFMEKKHQVHAAAVDDWRYRISQAASTKEEAEEWERLAFPGFREDLHFQERRPLEQEEREKKLWADAFVGAFPPRQHRVRPDWWWASLGPADSARWYYAAMEKGLLYTGQAGSAIKKLGSVARGAYPASAGDRWTWAILRQRKQASATVKPEPEGANTPVNYTSPGVLTQPSVHQLRWGGNTTSPASGVSTPGNSARVILPQGGSSSGVNGATNGGASILDAVAAIGPRTHAVL